MPMEPEELYNNLRKKVDALFKSALITAVEHEAFMTALEIAYEDSDDQLQDLIDTHQLN